MLIAEILVTSECIKRIFNFIHSLYKSIWLSRQEYIPSIKPGIIPEYGVSISLLIRVLNNQTPKNIIEAKLNFISKIGLTNHLSPTRANGLVEMVNQMKAYAYNLMIKKNKDEWNWKFNTNQTKNRK